VSYPLAVLSPLLGARSETFIRQHLTRLLPGRTACIYQDTLDETVTEWDFNGPKLQLPVPGRDFATKKFTGNIDPRSQTYFSLTNLERITHFLDKYGVRILLGQYMDQSLPWIDIARQTGRALFVHAHGYDVSMRLQNPDWRQAYLRFNQSDGIITVSQYGKQKLIDIGLNESLIHVIPCSVSPPACPSLLPSATPAKNELIRCLAVGRMVAKKGPLLALEAFAKALRSNPALRLDYIGDGPLMNAARQFIQSSGLGQRVILHGSQPHTTVQSLMSQADIFIHHAITDPDTGDQEGLPVAILEAMQHCLPVISTLHAGISEAVIDKQSGYLVPEHDISAMANKISRLAGDAAQRKKLGQSGRHTVEKKFSWQQEEQRLLSLMSLAQDLHQTS